VTACADDASPKVGLGREQRRLRPDHLVGGLPRGRGARGAACSTRRWAVGLFSTHIPTVTTPSGTPQSPKSLVAGEWSARRGAARTARASSPRAVDHVSRGRWGSTAPPRSPLEGRRVHRWRGVLPA
jgi:hypothetical protein